jgi:hypothetical protein
MEPYRVPDSLHQANWDSEKLLLKEILRALAHISEQLDEIYMEVD